MTEFAAPISTVNPVIEQRSSSLNVYTAYPHSFPSLPPTTASDAESLSTNTLDSSILVSAEESSGRMSLYLGGTLYLGELKLETDATTLFTQILPSEPNATSLAILYSTSHKSESLNYATFTLPLPTESLRTLARAATTIRVLLYGIFERLEEAVRLWTESTALGDKWIERLGNILESHGAGQAVPRQLMRMLLTGRITNGMKEYLPLKITERVGLLLVYKFEDRAELTAEFVEMATSNHRRYRVHTFSFVSEHRSFTRTHHTLAGRNSRLGALRSELPRRLHFGCEGSRSGY